jgi:hypothetical protein
MVKNITELIPDEKELHKIGASFAIFNKLREPK